MTDLAIKRFRFVLARSGGHGWGPERERLFAAAKHSLPARIAVALASRFGEGVALDITEPLRLSLRISLAELTSACAFDDGIAHLANRIVASWQPPELASSGGLPTPPGASESAADHVTPSVSPAATLTTRRVADSPLAAARAWLASGELDAILASLSSSALRSWLNAVIEELVGLSLEGSPAIEQARTEIRNERAEAAELRALITDVLCATSVDQPAATSGAAVSELDTAFALAVRDATPSNTVPMARGARRRPLASRPATPTTTVDGLALPFLLLRSLMQIGYLDALAASTAALGRDDLLPSIAHALAVHVLPAPGRGWQLSQSAALTAAAFSSAVDGAIDGAADLIAPAERVAARAVLAGHPSHRPLLLHRHHATLILAEPDGLLPVAWSASLDELLVPALPILAPIAVPARTADATLLAALDARGLRFITDAPPTRGETWRRLAAVRVWTNERSTADPSLAASLSAFSLVDDVDELLSLLGARHPRDVPPRIARSLASAAAIALGDLAHQLWSDREPTSPQLALSRFADLSARITSSPETIDVRIPHGARHRDLERAGFLGVRRAPWFGDRVVTIGVE